ncbi:hypothetical protein CDL12_30393 [Handroanthus impetiginosus]|uniref:Uncharacterized protein n=1 Tax=Handroanthus impetiginosus TaxID=429701 RepID=A0A2G9FWS4_9LAMI|nr:hypothetical protein CDL12_30393 [Handroanthus impetiginosus]
MAFHLRNSRKLPFSKSTQLSNFLTGNGGSFIGATELHSPGDGQNALRGRGIQGKQADGSSVSLCFLLNSFTHCGFNRTYHKISFILSHPSSLPTLQKSLPLVRQQNFILCLKPETLLCCLNKFRPFCKDVDSMRSDSEVESDGENESFVVDNAKFKTDQKELERVCKVIDETFAIDRNMEAVLDECGVNLSHGLVLGVLERFKHARKPALRFFCWAGEKPGLLRCKKRSDAIKLFELMKSKGPLPNVRSYTMLIKELSKHGNMNEAINYLEEMLNAGCEPDAAVYTCLMAGFAKQNKMDMVYRLLKEMKEKGCPPDGQTYNALIKMMTSRHKADEAAKIYKKMIQSGFQPSIHTYNMIMKSYFVAKDYEMGCAVWEEMKKKGCCPDENSYTVLIGGLIRQGRSNEACKYLEEMIDKGMKAPQLDYNKFTAAFSWAGRPDFLEELAQKMKFSGNFEVANRLARCLR